MDRRALILLAAALASCGPGQSQIRKAARQSAHRTLAVLPFDYRGGERNAGPAAADALARRLRGDGFAVYDRGKTRNVYLGSLDARAGAFDAVERSAELGRALGVSAVVVGSCDDAFERVDRRSAVYRWDPGARRRVMVSSAFSQRTAGVAVRVRLVDSATARVLWETRYAATLGGVGLRGVVDQAMAVVHDQFLDALLQGRL